MSNGDLNWITNFIWGIADDVLRDLYVRGKYRDVILPMMVLRRLDAVLEPTKAAVLAMKDNLDKVGITNQDAALRQAAGQAKDARLISADDRFERGGLPARGPRGKRLVGRLCFGSGHRQRQRRKSKGRRLASDLSS